MHYVVEANGTHLQIRATDPHLKHLDSRCVARKLDPERCSAARVRARLCVQTCKQGSDCTTCEIEHPVRVSACMWSARGRLGVAMEIVGKASSRRRLGSSSLHHLGIVTLWLGFSCRIFTHLTSHVSPPRLSAFAPFIFFPVCIHQNFWCFTLFFSLLQGSPVTVMQAVDRTFTHL